MPCTRPALHLARRLRLAEHAAAVGDGDVAKQVYFAGLGVDFNHCYMSAAGESGLALFKSSSGLGAGQVSQWDTG